MAKIGDNPTEDQMLKASKKAARKCSFFEVTNGLGKNSSANSNSNRES